MKIRETAKEAKKVITRKNCPLRDEWRTWSEEKQSDALFMVCPACGTNGSHVGEGKEIIRT